jgi:uncharacterized protein (TIGR02466 family)
MSTIHCKFFNPIPIARVNVEQDILLKTDQLSLDLFKQRSTEEDYPANDYLTIRGGEQRRVWPCIEDRSWLVTWIEQQAREYQISAGIDSAELVPKLANCWTITQPENSYQVVHTHPYGSISGNLYLEIPNFNNTSAETDGCISFLFDSTSNPKASRFVHVAPEVGTMLIFPSWIPHLVYPWQGAGHRRVIAWDCQLLPQ